MAVGLWLAAVTLHDVMEKVCLFGDLQGQKETSSLSQIQPHLKDFYFFAQLCFFSSRFISKKQLFVRYTC